MADILRNITFDTTDKQSPPEIIVAVKHYQIKMGNIGKEAPINFLTNEE